jgi:hypothetical protein
LGSILAVLIAGGILVELNMVVVQLLTRTLAGIEIEICLQRREFEEEDEFDLQYSHIYSSQLYCSIAIGLVGGALVGAAGGYPIGGMKSSPLRVALLIAGIAWFVLYVIATVVKYPTSHFLRDMVRYLVWLCAWYCHWLLKDNEKGKNV